MKQTKRILLLSNEQDPLVCLEGTLRVAGYDVQLRHRFDEIIILCSAHKGTDRQCDLLLVRSAPGRELHVQKLLHDRSVIAVLFADCQAETHEPYRIRGNIGWLHKESALLAAINDLLKNNQVYLNNENSEIAI